MSLGHDRLSGPALWLINGKLKSQNKVYKDKVNLEASYLVCISVTLYNKVSFVNFIS